jgi:hypothetical protein
MTEPDVGSVVCVAHPVTSRFLHVASGTSTTNTIAAALIPGRLSIWADPLHEGPVPAGLTDTELVDVRSRFLTGPAEPRAVDPVNDLKQWRAVIEHHESYDELILWFEHDLFDQLNLIQILSWIGERLPVAQPVSLVCIGSFPGHPSFKGLGELAPDDLRSQFETRQRVGEPQYSLAERAWRAFREPTPEALDDLRQGDTAALPYLAAAIGRFLQEYPWTIDGLSRTERRLLQLAEQGPIALSAAFPRMHDGEDAYYVTDASLEGLASSFAHTSPALLTLTRESSNGDWLEGSVTLTDSGRAVLAGRRDRIATCGIDRWLGGVHLRDANLWRWDDTQKTIRGPQR